MSTIYILGAGFSKTCGIATDVEMLSALNPLLDASSQSKDPDSKKTTIDYFLEQNFPDQKRVSFELFLSTMSAGKFLIDSLGPGKNVFRDGEKELKTAVKKYLRAAVRDAKAHIGWKTVLRFVRTVDWQKDFVLTFNYDLLVEAAAKELGVDVTAKIIHLHGAVNERYIAWPTYTKFAYRNIKEPLGPRWKKAFEILPGKVNRNVDRWVFIGYSLPSSDLEAANLFRYADWYNQPHNYELLVINPDPNIQENYRRLRNTPLFIPETLESWILKAATDPTHPLVAYKRKPTLLPASKAGAKHTR